MSRRMQNAYLLMIDKKLITVCEHTVDSISVFLRVERMHINRDTELSRNNVRPGSVIAVIVCKQNALRLKRVGAYKAYKFDPPLVARVPPHRDAVVLD